jgi:ribosomal protein S18
LGLQGGKRVALNPWEAAVDPADVRDRSGWEWDEWRPAVVRPRLSEEQGPPPTTMHEVEFFKERYPSIKTIVTCDAGVVAEYIDEIKGSPPPERLLVGLDTEWIQLRSGGYKLALLQLCVGSSCLIYQVHHAGYKLPDVLSKFLSEEGHIFVGAHITNDAERLQEDCGVKISNWKDLQLIVADVDEKYSHLYRNGYRSSLEKIGNRVLELPLYKDRNVNHRLWGLRVLHEWQVQYAAKDAFLSFEIANQLEIKHGYRFLPDAHL